ncbi:hypothetical protein MARSALSMR5_04102 (plasmid) [Marinobacter salarius]|uniref:DUF4143 domain-containing protein n=2 Tax=Marinobacter salarius TaxID=1420917 RepID=A0A1W6KFM2_9GAMM|nr:hypothetical protein MARSALSMR5_04102 [Marinobacter salarius]
MSLSTPQSENSVAAPPTGTEERLEALIGLLSRGQFDYADETRCQLMIENFLLECGAVFRREFQLTDGIVDFFFPRSGLCLEVKASKQWSRRAVYRQCERYCKDDRVTGLVLATGRSQGLPELINGKPVRVFPLGAAFL